MTNLASRSELFSPPRKQEAQGQIIWFIGLSGSGKTTISSGVADILISRDVPVCLLDGDVLRQGLCSDLGFSASDRAENIRRTAHLAKLLAEVGMTVLVATISPLQMHRDIGKSIVPQLVEIFVDAPLEVCEARDPKGLYHLARSGELHAFTGVSSPFERPQNPDLTCSTDKQEVEESVRSVLAFLDSQGKWRACI